MKKIVRLTESDLVRLVKRVINEQKDDEYMVLSPGQTYEFLPVKLKGNVLFPLSSFTNAKILNMKILSFDNSVLVGQVGQNKLMFDEKYLQNTSESPKQRYFCQKNNTNKCIYDTQMGFTKSGERRLGQQLSDFMEKGPSEFTTIDENNFDSLVLKSTVPFVVDFSAPWCGPCRATAVQLSELKREYGNKFNMGKINIDVERPLAKKFDVSRIPVVMIFKNGEMVKRIDGMKTKEEYKTEIDSFL